MNKILLILFLLLLNSCGYTSVYKNQKSQNFQINITGMKGDIEFNNLMIEAKRYAAGHWHKEAWWDQTLTSAGDTHIPLLIYKYDRQPIKFVFRLSDLMGAGYEDETASVDYETGIMLMRELLKFK